MKPNHLFYLTCLFGLFLLLSCGEDQQAPNNPLRPVKYTTVDFLQGVDTRTFSGTARTEKIINLSFRSGGILTELNIKLGQNVQKGELLARLDNVTARLNYESAVASQNSAESQMNTAKLALDRIRVLYEKGSASLTDFESAKNSYKTAQQGYESARRSVAIQQEQIRFGYLYAPEDGVVTSISAEVDETISAGQPIAVMNAGTEMQIALGFPESIINEVAAGMPVSVRLPAQPDQEFTGRVSELSPAVDNNSATYPARIQVDDPGGLIKTGMAANVTLELNAGNAPNTTLTIPPEAVGEDSQGRFVYVIDESGDTPVVRRTSVTVGSLDSRGFELVSGLQRGQKIATAGLQTLLDGQQVTLFE
ncbi:efflux RND transporter periplasmic adaptor subunit [Robiginitalea sediminis]|uniref:efflux RND transporter periplasmic adaptor subunit n=1 Tax=Robiginitalea sediminis TaxID=1982593 RepID=UPI000B4ACF54|nr:efflux RND transporter periplasmic adaptor subunit [Robiginitalea sediminis]